jgi:hypothetical protein
VKIATPLEKLLCKDTKYIWTQECQEALDTLKEKLVTMSILVFPDWSKLFHVHVDASSIALGVVLVQPGEGNIDHLVYFSSCKLSDVENNYTTTEIRGVSVNSSDFIGSPCFKLPQLTLTHIGGLMQQLCRFLIFPPTRIYYKIFQNLYIQMLALDPYRFIDCREKVRSTKEENSTRGLFTLHHPPVSTCQPIDR